jgi:hypothetical protein
VVTFTAFSWLGGWQDYLGSRSQLKAILDNIHVRGGALETSLLNLLDLVWVLAWSKGTLELLASIAVSFAICSALMSFVTSRVQDLINIASDEDLSVLLLVLGLCGFKRAFKPSKKHAGEQRYAEYVRAAALLSKTVKVLCISGYEYFGRGQDSLLYQAINQRPDIRVEFITLDPNEGKAIIAERVRRLAIRDDTFDEEKILSQIARTTSEISELHRKGGRAVFHWQCKIAPVFRLIILDDCLFVNGYSNAHGHESPMFQVTKYDDDHMESYWYDCFDQYYTMVKTQSKQII